MNSGESPQDATANYGDNNHHEATQPNRSTPVPNISDGKTATAMSLRKGVSGTIFEAAFVDSAYSWPPAEGQGKNAIELQASTALMRSAAHPNDNVDDLDDDEISLTPSMMSSDDEGGSSRNKHKSKSSKGGKKLFSCF